MPVVVVAESEVHLQGDPSKCGAHRHSGLLGPGSGSLGRLERTHCVTMEVYSVVQLFFNAGSGVTFARVVLSLFMCSECHLFAAYCDFGDPALGPFFGIFGVCVLRVPPSLWSPGRVCTVARARAHRRARARTPSRALFSKTATEHRHLRVESLNFVGL